MAVRFSEDPGRFIGRFQNDIKKVDRELRDDLKSGVELGAEFMRERIIGIPRIDTWKMFNSVESTVWGNQHAARGTFGWINTREDYFVYQEEGTKHVSAMFALSDAVDFVQSLLGAKVSERMRRG